MEVTAVKSNISVENPENKNTTCAPLLLLEKFIMSNDQNRSKRNIFLHLPVPPLYKCIECKRSMSAKNHYVKLMQYCSQCPYGTQCRLAFHSHVQQHDSSLQGSLAAKEDVFRKHEVLDLTTIECSCGFETRFGNKYCKHVIQCLLSDKSVVKEWTPSKTASNFLPVKMQESLGLIRRFNSSRFKSPKALSTRRKLKMRKKRRISHCDNHPLDNYSQCCSKLDKYSLILAQKVSNIERLSDYSLSFHEDVFRKTLLLALPAKNNKPLIRLSKVPSPILSELPFSLEQWNDALAQFSQQHSSSSSNNSFNEIALKQKNNVNDHNDDFNFVPYPESIIM